MDDQDRSEWPAPGGVPPWQPRFAALNDLGVLDLAKRIVVQFFEHFWSVVGVIAIVYVPLSVIEALLFGDAFRQSAPSAGAPWPPELPLGPLGFAAWVLISIVASTLVLAAGVRAVAQTHVPAERRQQAGALYRSGARVLLTLIGVILLASLVVFAGTLLLVIPGIFFFVRLYLATPAVVVEGSGVIEPLQRSWTLAKGAFWRIFGVLIVVALIAVLASIVLSIPAGLAALVPGPIGWVFEGLASGVLVSVMFAFATTAVVILYLDRRGALDPSFGPEVLVSELEASG